MLCTRKKEGRAALLGLALLCIAGCDGQTPRDTVPGEHLHSDRGGIGVTAQAATAAPITVDPRRSLVVTDTAVLSGFTLQGVMDQLVTQSGVPGLTSTQLFKQLWDTQNPAPGLGLGAHCTDNGNTLNGFPYACRSAEGAQAGDGSANLGSYFAVGLFNRFDLAPAGGADCGEYRIVFAKNGTGGGRNFMIFEAVLPNPQPELGLEGCRPVVDFWRSLSGVPDTASRAASLRRFYFQGLRGFLPVVHLENYGSAVGRVTGQVRTNQFMQPRWVLREFQLRKTCGTSGCSLQFWPVTDKTNPFGGLFRATSSHPLTSDFQNTFFPSAVASLAVNDINTFNYEVPDRFNGGQSDAEALENNYSAQFSTSSALASRIQGELTRLGSPLTPAQIVARAQALSCAGCHQLSNGANLGGGLQWPGSLGFVHVSESLEPGPEGNRFRVSPALTGVFIPRRRSVFEGFLNRPGRMLVANFREGAPAQARYRENFGESTSFNGWQDTNDLALSGDFMGVGHDQALFINQSGTAGRVFIADVSAGSVPAQMRYWEEWGMSTQLNGWHDADDLRLVGDFMGLGRQQVMFINRSGTAGRVMIADFGAGTVPAQVRYLEGWGESTQLNGWHDADDLQLVGDFMGLGHDQVMFINRSGTAGRVMIADFSAGRAPAQVRYLESWGDSFVLDGWHDADDLPLVGDFAGLGSQQVLFVNRSPSFP